MSKYVLLGDYTINVPICEKKNDLITVRVPLIGESGMLLYGINNSLTELKRQDIYPSENGIDLLCLAALAYLADTRISRLRHSQNSWTREIEIVLPVYNLELWQSTRETFMQMLNFLTGDRWSISFANRNIILSEDKETQATFDVVSLFSGGMDSLIGTINHLEQNHKIALVSHAGDGFTKSAQQKLLMAFNDKFPNQSSYFNLWMVFKKNYLQDGGVENTTRSRSFLL